MDWMYLFYFFLAMLVFFGAESMGRGNWNEEYTSLKQTKILQGITALGIALHHMAQKTCAPWHPRTYTVHGLDPFLSIGYLFVAVFFFCSGLGLYKSFRTKPDYLKGFFRRRILPVIIAFYLSEIIYTAVRLLMGEKMDFRTVLWYLSGLHMANFNSWYVIVIPFFYLVFQAAFRFCKREGTAIFWVFLFTLGYTVLGACIDHQDDWWMRGEWWYNSILLFPLGLLFAKYEEKITRVMKKGYWFWLILSFALIFLLFQQSEWLNNHRWGYYGEWGDRLKIQHRLMSTGMQWSVCIAYVAFWFLLMMKVKLGNKALAWLGAVTLDFYLIHGIFVELFGYNFLDISKSLVYIKNVPLYTAAVLGCSVPATLLFRLIREKITALTQKKDRQGKSAEKKKKTPGSRLRGRRERDEAYGKSRFRRFLVPGLTVLVLAGVYFLLQSGTGDRRKLIMEELEFHPPEGFVLQRAEGITAVWKYEGEKNAGYLILDSEIPDANSRSLDTLEKVYEECDWLTEKEYYTNPQGIRMIRAFTDISGSPERRYYIESARGLMLLRMIENDQFYNRDDCEEAILRTADSVRAVK